jgi:hypothetical protein
MTDNYTLKVRGKRVFVGTHMDCINELFMRWGWVPFNIFEAVLKPEIIHCARRVAK